MRHEQGPYALLHHLLHIALHQAHGLQAAQDLALCQPVHVLPATLTLGCLLKTQLAWRDRAQPVCTRLVPGTALLPDKAGPCTMYAQPHFLSFHC